MTHNQIEYWKNEEDKRHNRVEEQETNRHNVVTEGETGRHNRATEGIDLGQLQEYNRHNLATEAISRGNQSIELSKLNETSRHNKASENLQGWDLNLQNRSLNETVRHNEATEANQTAQVAAESAYKQALTEYQDIVNTWEGLKRSADVSLTDAQKRQAEQYIQKLSKEIEQMDQNMSYKTYEEILNGAGVVNQLLRTGAEYIDALVPG